MSENLHLDTSVLDQAGDVFFEEDEPVEDIQAAFEAGEKGETDPEKGKVVELFGTASGSAGVR